MKKYTSVKESTNCPYYNEVVFFPFCRPIDPCVKRVLKWQSTVRKWRLNKRKWCKNKRIKLNIQGKGQKGISCEVLVAKCRKATRLKKAM